MIRFDKWLSVLTSFGFLLIIISSLLFVYQYLGGTASSRRRQWGWGAVFGGLLLLMRLPFIAYNRELEVDESQMLTQALSLTKYIHYWNDVDGLTQGPLVSYLLILPSWFGGSFDYISARLVGFVLLSLTLLFTYRTVHNLFAAPVSLAVFVPTAFFYLLVQGWFCELYNEYVVLCLLAITFWLFSSLYNQPYPTFGVLLALGFVSGLVPFAKLQGVPTVLVTLLFTALIILSKSPKKILSLLVLLAGCLCCPLIVLVLTLLNGSFDYFLNFYLIGNFQYSYGGSIWQKALDYPTFLQHSGQFIDLFITYAVLIAAYLWVSIRSSFRFNIRSFLVWFGLLHVLTGFYEAIKSGYQFYHYQQFLIIPLALLSGALWDGFYATRQVPAPKVRLILAGWVLLCCLPYGIDRLVLFASSARPVTIRLYDLGQPIPVSPISKKILSYTRPGDDLTLWGWFPAYHIETQLSQATADNITFRVLMPGPQQQRHQARFLEDLKRHRPAVFVDLVNRTHSFWFLNPDVFGHEQVVPIGTYIQTHYQHVATINDERVYVRKDRLRESELPRRH
ncbi:hypothetical protein [Spirosoma radiotolerans]|uniref:Glycosyltransferase RgtA/B/C/D-like domain-containing protein n=1 Tax=Spirosoma radiotolerans TaxID=1379870 RepID=A0A0E3V6Z0_9BACT|nr:hypothetical protein [Spirosoma radiotolerans]AKD55427.1 hypothetical protein SD10_11445 [Spirosoma radiotolerans]